MITIKELRTKHNINLSQLATALEVNTEDIQDWENNQPTLEGSTIIKLAKFFKVTTDELLGVSVSGKNKITKHNYLTVEKTQEMSTELFEIMEDLEILRGYSKGFAEPSRLDKTEIYLSYVRAYKFMDQFFYKAQRLENRLDDMTVLLSEAGSYDTLQEYLPLEEMNLPKIKG